MNRSVLPATLDALQKAMKAIDMAGEMIVADNNSRDRTPEIAREHGAIVVFEPINQISRARNAGAKAARGRYLIFLDADTIISPRCSKKHWIIFQAAPAAAAVPKWFMKASFPALSGVRLNSGTIFLLNSVWLPAVLSIA